ncbi:outer membrane protein assembly factor BamB [Rhodopirellula rubra]|uniref:Outer membrane protein assembly factor BamB n=1 Tax=Aporhodopirellula rubra TaxID=980271 RepID=A0A7W5DW30_9BACT|nr:PQQ-binding-like beta-propeller repeat protein [Aporhodopirellula rubra]MBB3205242.1 outer membrane protein assembly factor BamB [Aporhodopirellula rubra]
MNRVIVSVVFCTRWLLLLLCVMLLVSSRSMAEPVTGWFGFRGDGTSVAERGPSRLSIEDDSNRTWKREMPGRSVAGPIVIDDLVITTSSSGPSEENLFVTGVDLNSGAVVWQQQFRATGRPFFHPTGAGAAPSPVTDGERVVALFSSNDLVCLSTDGALKWVRGLGRDYEKAGNDLGMASSPVIAGDVVIVQVESQGDSFAAGIDLNTGENRWRIKRPPLANWSSPAVVRFGDGAYEVVLQSQQDVLALDAGTGETRWTLGEGRGTIPSPTVSGKHILLPGSDLLVMKATAPGETPVELWRDGKLAPKNPSVAAGRDQLYVLKGSVLLKADLATGDTVWKSRLSGLGATWATPVVAGNSIYVFDQSGIGLVVADGGDSGEVVSQVELEEGVLGTPAVANGRLVVRSKTMLHCFE